MSAPRVIPDKRCAYSKCRRVFRPNTMKRALDAESCCSRSCANKRHFKAHPEAFHRLRRAGIVSQMRQARRRLAVDLVEQFGRLTPREIAILNAGLKRGYLRGYLKAYAPSPRRSGARSAAA